MRTDKDIDDLLRGDASAQLGRAEEVPDLHRSMMATLARTSTIAPRSRLRSALVPVSAAVAAAVIIATPIVIIDAHHGKPREQAPPAAAPSSPTSPQPAISSSCAFQAVQATIDDQAPRPLLSCTGFARGAYSGSSNLPVLAAKVGATVLIGGSLLGHDARLSLTTGTASLLTRVSDHEWQLRLRQVGQLTVQVSSPELCRGSHQPCGLVAVSVSQ